MPLTVYDAILYRAMQTFDLKSFLSGSESDQYDKCEYLLFNQIVFVQIFPHMHKGVCCIRNYCPETENDVEPFKQSTCSFRVNENVTRWNSVTH